jgi:TolB-like protein
MIILFYFLGMYGRVVRNLMESPLKNHQGPRGAIMKKSTLIIALMVILLTGMLAVPAGADFKKSKIAVLDFQLQGHGFETADMGKIVAEWLITAFVKDGRFDVIERSLLEKILGEQKLGVSGLVDTSSASRIGKVLGAKAIISGSVMRFQNIVEVNARIIDVQDGSIIAAENVKSTSTAKLEALVVTMSEKIIRDFPLEGYIVQKGGNSVVIDLGRRAGVKKGMQFSVFKEGNVIKHPKTGEVLDVERIETGVVKISDVKDKTATAAIVKEITTNAIAYGQLVKNISDVAEVPPEAEVKENVELKRTETAREKRIEGMYNVAGTNPNGTTYGGMLTISRNDGAYTFVWRIGSSTFRGTGNFQGDSLVIDWGQAYPVIYKVAEDSRLIGTWNNGSASEVLTPLK